MARSPDFHHRASGGGGRTNLASCLLATAFLLLLLVAATVALFILFRPRDPEIRVSAFQLPGFAAANGTLRFTFNQYAAVRNPNRAAFSHYDSTLQLVYAGNQVGFMFIPAGQIAGGRTQHMAASFPVDALPLAAAAALPPGAAGAVEVDSRMSVKGRVRVLRFFTHHVQATAGCRVGISAVEVDSRMSVKGRVRVLRFFTHHVQATAGCRVGISAADGSVLGFRC